METNTIKILDIKTLIGPVKRHLFIVFLAMISVIITVGYLTFTAKSVYEASATLSIREAEEFQNQFFNMPSFLAQKSLINNQIVFLKSRSMAGEVIKRLQTLPGADSLRILGKRKSVERQSIKTKILTKLGRPPKKRKPPTFKDHIAKFQKNTRISVEAESNVIVLNARSSVATEAAILVNAWLEAYQAYSRAETQGEIIQTKEFIEAKLAEVERLRDHAQQALAQYQKREKVIALSEETQQLVEQTATYQSEYNRTRTDIEAAENELIYSKSQLAEAQKLILGDIEHITTPGIKAIQKQIADKEAKKAELEGRMIGADVNFNELPQLQTLSDGIEGLKKRLAQEMKKRIDVNWNELNPVDRSDALLDRILTLESELQSLNAREQKQKSILIEYNKKLESLPDKSLKLADLQMDVQVNNRTYLTFRENYEQIKIREAGQMDFVRIVDWAEPPKFPVLPQKGRNLFMGFFFGILLGVGMAYSKDYFEDAIRSPKELDRFNLRLLGTVIQYGRNKAFPRYRFKNKTEEISRAKAIYPHLITHRHNHSSIAETYRSIRTALYFAEPEKPWRTLMVCSGEPGEGKSTTSANLAITIAQKGVKTLLIDADLRRPVLDILFTGSHRKMGLSNVLGANVDWHETVRESTIKNLYVMGAGVGVKNTSELISSSALPVFLNKVRKEYGAVIFDSAPLLPVTDAVVMASLMDGVIMVARADKTRRESFNRSLNLLRDVKARIFGVILTGVKRNDPYGYQDYYSAYVDAVNDEAILE